jgi:hypothetical protein
MQTTLRVLAVLAPLGAAALLVVPDAGCGSSSGGGQGGERQGCYPNGTCNAGLTCASGLCVNLDGSVPNLDGGSSDADAAPPGTDASADVGTPPPDGASLSDAAGDAATDSGPVCAPPTGTTFAMTQLLFGNGSSGQWKSVGFDIDGQTWTAGSTTHCLPNSGATPSAVFPNGNNGIDNSFGENVLPLLLELLPTWPTDTNSAIQNGTFSALLKLYCLPASGDTPSLLTKLFNATALGSTPKLDGTDAWPVAPELLSDTTNPESSTITFPMSSVAGSVFDSGANQAFALALPVGTASPTTWLTLTMSAAKVTMTLAADRKSTTGGVVGGVLDTEDFVSQLEQVGYAFNLCNQSGFAGVITSIRQASDIMSDGTQDPTKTCDGISIGLGFEMTLAQRGGVGPAKPTQMACP